MRITVIGLGYIGSVGAACLAELGHDVIGVDIDTAKVERLNAGKASIIEDGLSALIAQHTGTGRLRATVDGRQAIATADAVFITVGTPSLPGGEADLQGLRAVCGEIQAALAERRLEDPLAIAVRSTVPPGTVRGVVIPEIAGQQYRHGEAFMVGSNPEFLREGTAVSDFMHSTFTLVGADHDELFEVMEEAYAPIGDRILRTHPEGAELVKYASNAYHALKVCFANEVGTLAGELGLDGREVMDIFSRERVLNISSKYLTPGFSYGGSCLPKDVHALNVLAEQLDVDTPLMASIPRSNDAHTQRGLELVAALDRDRVSLFGLAFKRGTADLRSSPLLFLMEQLQVRGYDVRVHDANVSAALAQGLYEASLAEAIRPYVVDYERAAGHAQVAVIGKATPRYRALDAHLAEGVAMIDLAGQYRRAPQGRPYFGSCWERPARRTGQRAARPGASPGEQAGAGEPGRAGSARAAGRRGPGRGDAD